MRRLATTLLGVLALAFASCGEDREDEGGVTVQGGGTTGTGGTTATTRAPGGPAVATVRVTETEFRLDPANPRIAEPGVIEFDVRNDGRTVHALEVEGPAGEAETEDLPPGESATLRVELPPGRYTWYCPVGDHEDRGMRGTITVAGGAGSTPDTTPEGTGGASAPGY